jgi:Nucleotidyl transferase AbiEii toxin, Type IV TA system
MPVSDFQRQVATLALRAAARHGFVLGGGNALILHGIVDRYTADVDLMTDRPEGVRAAADAVEQALRSAGLAAERQDRDAGLAMAKNLEPGLADEEFADAGQRLDRLSDTVFARYGLAPDDVAQLRKRFADWPRS